MTDSLDEAVDEVLGFYRVYHSMRYVGGDLVLRLQKAPPPALLERIRTEFADVIKAGTFEPTAPCRWRPNEAHLASLPRLRFRFDRHSLGRLRQLIDLINREGGGGGGGGGVFVGGFLCRFPPPSTA